MATYPKDFTSNSAYQIYKLLLQVHVVFMYMSSFVYLLLGQVIGFTWLSVASRS
jgi:hypothetical protein